jgi:hypothetical protein
MSRSDYSARPGGQLIDLQVARLSNRITYRPPAAMDYRARQESTN